MTDAKNAKGYWEHLCGGFSRYMYSKRKSKAIDRFLLFEMWNAERFRAAMKSTVPASPSPIYIGC
jgi:hypothetical protein